jgi:C-type mannose receptor
MCYKDAIRNDYHMFGLQNNGECWSGKDIELTYSKYGESGNCKDGLGGAWANDVYSISEWNIH